MTMYVNKNWRHHRAVYHVDAECSYLTSSSKGAKEVTENYVEQRDLGPCSRCAGGEAATGGAHKSGWADLNRQLRNGEVDV